jgi:hypothetical protein
MKKSVSDPGLARSPGRGERALSAKARRARENGAYVRRLLRQRAPEFAETLAAAEHDVSCDLSSKGGQGHRCSDGHRPAADAGQSGFLPATSPGVAGTPVPGPRRAPGLTEP